MRCVVGMDLGSTTTKAVLLDERGELVGRGITNSRSSYEVACAVAREEALTAARFTLLERRLAGSELTAPLVAGFRLELYRDELAALRDEIRRLLALPEMAGRRDLLAPAVEEVLAEAAAGAPALFAPGAQRKSDFFRDVAGAAFVAGAERIAESGEVPFDRLLALYDRAILEVETSQRPRSFAALLRRSAARLVHDAPDVLEAGAVARPGHDAPTVHEGRAAARSGREAEEAATAAGAGRDLASAIEEVAGETIEELAFAGTGYGRQTLPFPKESVRSEILCHGRGAHRVFPGTRSVLDIGGQDTKAIQVDARGVVTSFQMNDRCAAGCGRYLGYIADELNLGLHELGPLALTSRRRVKVSSTCTVFAGTELRERLALGEKREDVLAGLHRAMLLRAMSLLARSGGVRDEFTFTGGVCKNPMAVKILGELVPENYGPGITIHTHADSIYMGALGAALFALDDLAAGRPGERPAATVLGER